MNIHAHKRDACVTFLDLNQSVDITRRDLPHWSQGHVWYFVSFRLADSIPRQAVERIRADRAAWLEQIGAADCAALTSGQRAEYHRLFSGRMEELLNAGRGCCILRDERTARLAADAFRFFEGDRYLLGAWVIMPNHIHVLVAPLGDHRLRDILHTWKSYTAKAINKALARTGEVWHHESYDHIVRNERSFDVFRTYIVQNPVKAGITLCGAAQSNASVPLAHHTVTGETPVQLSASVPACAQETTP
jgi:REP element-mobilizing transposase RayT